MPYTRKQFYFFFFWFFIVVILTGVLFLPYFSALLLAAALAVIFSPLHQVIERFLGRYIKWRQGEIARIFSVIITLGAVIILVLAPLTLIASKLVLEVKSIYQGVINNQEIPFLRSFFSLLEKHFGLTVSELSFNFNVYLRQVLSWVLQNIGRVFSRVGSAFVSLFVSLLGFYYFLKDGRQFKNFFFRLSPLPPEDNQKIFSKVVGAINSVIRGQIVVALIQGFLTGVGFSLFAVPQAVLWGAVAALAALVPSFGTSLVLVPGVLYLFFLGKLSFALGLAVWGVLAVGLIDNFLGPRLIKRGTSVHPFLILLSVLGGISTFGLIGFLLGPLIISLFFAFIDIYRDVGLSK